MQTSTIEILEFKPKYARHFQEINQSWLEEFFTVEPYDRIVLDDPLGEIIARGGAILFASIEGEIVGTCALIKHTDTKYELAKMGVVRSHRGKGIGRKLALAAIAKAKKLGAASLVLATSPNLEAANALYHSMGFQEVGLEEIGPLPYKENQS
ncbi:MAG: GNAT family N-acetyltransferase [bacterium]|nr:GNAT family N-acetyltransferase [bacterium]